MDFERSEGVHTYHRKHRTHPMISSRGISNVANASPKIIEIGRSVVRHTVGRCFHHTPEFYGAKNYYHHQPHQNNGLNLHRTTVGIESISQGFRLIRSRPIPILFVCPKLVFVCEKNTPDWNCDYICCKQSGFMIDSSPCHYHRTTQMNASIGSLCFPQSSTNQIEDN